MLLRLAACMAIACLVHACVQDCTEAGCVGGLGVALAAPNGWQSGAYELEFEADDVTTHRCSFGVTARETTTELTQPLSCTPGVQASGVHVLGCPMLLATAGAAATDPACPAVGMGVRLSSVPRSVRVLLSRDGAPVLAESVTPEYQRLQPNGEDCPPVCHSASVKLSLP
jgi:hypothetical protein